MSSCVGRFTVGCDSRPILLTIHPRPPDGEVSLGTRGGYPLGCFLTSEAGAWGNPSTVFFDRDRVVDLNGRAHSASEGNFPLSPFQE